MALISSIVRSTTSSPITFQNSSSIEIGTLCRAWVNFDGNFATSPFTIANGGIRASFNVSSITDRGTGNYTMNFTTAMVDANFAASGITGIGSTDTQFLVVLCDEGKTASTFLFKLLAVGSSAGVDREHVHVQIFR